jgi:hypothetical protein
VPNRERKAVTMRLAQDFRVVHAGGDFRALVNAIGEDNRLFETGR